MKPGQEKNGQDICRNKTHFHNKYVTETKTMLQKAPHVFVHVEFNFPFQFVGCIHCKGLTKALHVVKIAKIYKLQYYYFLNNRLLIK